MELDELRKKIDDVDAEICALLARRFDLAKEIGKVKLQAGADVENKSRERVVLERVRANLPDEYKDYAEKVFLLLIEESKDLQRKL